MSRSPARIPTLRGHTVKLSTFIRCHIEAILAQWDTFARDNSPQPHLLSHEELRDHAREMLMEIAADMEARQTDREQQRKSEGHGASGHEGRAATEHGKGRQLHKYTLLQVSAEFRSLRATVLRLWEPYLEHADTDALHEVIRFNEGIDQALAESIAGWARHTGETRDLFLAVLGHDLRSPLASIALAGDMLAGPALPPERLAKVAFTVTRATRIMSDMINDLMGFASTQLGGDIPQHPVPCDLLAPLNDAIADATATYPGARFQLHAPATLIGRYDRGRLYQMFLNLLVNAARHGAEGCPVLVEAGTRSTDHVVSVTNKGEPIPPQALESIFQPLVQLTEEDHVTRPPTSLGLGLFIARKIAEGHGGGIQVASNQSDGTRFTVTLPTKKSDA
jgi:signal transduction histidine kinase